MTDDNYPKNIESKGLPETITVDKDEDGTDEADDFAFDEDDDGDETSIVQDDISDDDGLLPTLDDKEDV